MRQTSTSNRSAASLLLIAITAGCGGATPIAGEHSAALEPSQDFPSTTYRFELTTIDIMQAVEPDLPSEPDDKAWTPDTGYVYWAALAAQTKRLNPDGTYGATSNPYTTACALGPGSENDVLGACKDGAPNSTPFQEGQPLYAYATVEKPTDQIRLAVALDNIESIQPKQVTSSASDILSGLGNVFQFVGTAAGLILTGPAASVGPLIGFLGNEFSVGSLAISLPPGAPTGAELWEITCTGGLLGDLDPKTGKHPDTMFIQFTPDQLQQMTSDGPVKVRYLVGRTDPDEAKPDCVSSVYLTLTISREWSTGLSAQTRSSDGAVARSLGEIDAFFPHAIGTTGFGSIERHLWQNGGWLTDSVDDVHLQGSTPIASLSPSNDVVEAYYVDEYGSLFEAAWHNGAPVQLTNVVPNAVPPHAPIAATARMPSNRDLFYIGSDGSVRTVWWTVSNSARGGRAISGTQLAPPEGGIAAVARTATNLDVFFVGWNGGLQTTWWHQGMTDWGYSPVSSPRLASPGAPVAAVARQTGNLDVFFVGRDASGTGVVYQSQWNDTVGQWSTRPIGATLGLVNPSAPIRSISVAYDQLNVVVVGKDRRLYWLQSQADSNVWTMSPISAPNFESNLSVAARTPTIWNAFYLDANGVAQALDFSYSDQKWYPFTLPYATLRQGGLYPFAAVDPTLCVDVTGGGNVVEGARLLLARCSGRASQRWSFDADGHIVNAADPTLCVDYGNAPSLRRCGSSSTQKWLYTNGELAFYSNFALKCLDVAGGQRMPAAFLDTTSCTGSAAQQFVPFDIPMQIVTSQQAPGNPSPQCADQFRSYLPPYGMGVESAYCNGSAKQTYMFDESGRLTVNGQCLDAINKNQNQEVALDACGAAWTQRWTFDGKHLQSMPYYQALTYSTPGCLEVYQNRQTPGALIDYNACNNSTGQTWTLADSAGGRWPFAALPR